MKWSYKWHKSARAYHHRVLKIARTLVDLDGREDIGAAQVCQAIRYRSLNRILRE